MSPLNFTVRAILELLLLKKAAQMFVPGFSKVRTCINKQFNLISFDGYDDKEDLF